jgi:hypothetical protein
MYKVLTACLLTIALSISAHAKSAGEKKVEVIKAVTVAVCKLPEFSHLEHCQTPEQP